MSWLQSFLVILIANGRGDCSKKEAGMPMRGCEVNMLQSALQCIHAWISEGSVEGSGLRAIRLKVLILHVCSQA